MQHIRVTVIFAPGARQVIVRDLTLAAGATAAHAVRMSGWPAVELAVTDDMDAPMLGLWGRRCAPDQVLRDLDRVEIYRPLRVDPKLARRLRFARQGARATGLFARKRPGAKAGY